MLQPITNFFRLQSILAVMGLSALLSLNSSALSAEEGCGTCCYCEQFCDGFEVGVEAVVATHFASEGHGNTSKWVVMPRVWFGGNNCDGLGLRARGFYYENSKDQPVGVNDEYELATVDVEITQLYRPSCHTDLLFSFGGRYAWYREIEIDTSTDLDKFDGGGAIVGVEVYRKFCGGFALFVIGRQSLLFNTSEDTTFSSEQPHDLAAVTDLQMGVEWASCVCDWDFFIRGSYDTQYWHGVANQDTEDFGLMGASFALGVNF